MSGLVGYRNNPIKIITGADEPNAKEWRFDDLGNITIPTGGDIVNSDGLSVLSGDSNVRKTIANVTISTPTVIWTSSTPGIGSAKLFVQAECDVIDDLSGPHTQSCEIIVASRSNLSDPVISVYGLVYTSNSHLLTFTAQRNLDTNNIEILADATLIVGTNPLLRIYSVEQLSRI